jgi:tetratricopeptide (TPR) repeat protein
LCERAAVLFRAQRPQEALVLYEQASRMDPRLHEARRGLSFAYRAVGEFERAEQATARALESDPHDYELVHLRSSLRPQTALANHVSELETMLVAGITGWRGAVHVGYALAKELEDMGQYERSFSYLQAAATLKRNRTRYDPQADLTMLEQIRTHYDAQALQQHRGQGHTSRAPIFIFGLPRTGSTLLERILSCHPQIHSCGELDTFALELTRLVAAADGGHVPARGALLSRSLHVDLQSLGRSYLERVPPAPSDRTHFIDKLPLNSLYAGLIHLALPGATMIWLQRDPMDTCYAIYKFLFSGAYPFSYDLTELGQYYLAHRRLMEHWRQVLPPGALLTVGYEQLVTDQEHHTRRLLDALGLPWDPACMAFERNPQPSITGSAVQVRQPVYSSSINAWRRYERQLEPLRQMLVAGGAYADPSH